MGKKLNELWKEILARIRKSVIDQHKRELITDGEKAECIDLLDVIEIELTEGRTTDEIKTELEELNLAKVPGVDTKDISTLSAAIKALDWTLKRNEKPW